MSLATIRNPILRDLGLDSSSSLVNDAKQRILDYINEGIQELNILGGFEILKTEASVTLVTDTADYSLATDCDVTGVIGERFYIDSDDAIAYNNSGFSYFYQGQYDLAIEDYNKTIELDTELDLQLHLRHQFL